MFSHSPVPTLARYSPSHGWSLEGKSTSTVPGQAILLQSRSTPNPSMGGKSTGKGITFILVDLILDFKGKTYFDICLALLLVCFVEKYLFIFLLMPEEA